MIRNTSPVGWIPLLFIKVYNVNIKINLVIELHDFIQIRNFATQKRQELAVSRIEEAQDHLVEQVSGMREQVSNNAVQSRLENIAHHLNRASQQSTLDDRPPLTK